MCHMKMCLMFLHLYWNVLRVVGEATYILQRWVGSVRGESERRQSPLCTIRGDADKSLARLTSRCMTDSIVSEWWACSCAELQVLLLRLKGSMSGDARNFNIDTRAVKFFSARQGAEWNSRHSDKKTRGTCTIVCYPSETWWPSLNVVIFPHVMCLVLDDPKQRPPRRSLITFTN